MDVKALEYLNVSLRCGVQSVTIPENLKNFILTRMKSVKNELQQKQDKERKELAKLKGNPLSDAITKICYRRNRIIQIDTLILSVKKTMPINRDLAYVLLQLLSGSLDNMNTIEERNQTSCNEAMSQSCERAENVRNHMKNDEDMKNLFQKLTISRSPDKLPSPVGQTFSKTKEDKLTKRTVLPKVKTNSKIPVPKKGETTKCQERVGAKFDCKFNQVPLYGKSFQKLPNIKSSNSLQKDFQTSLKNMKNKSSDLEKVKPAKQNVKKDLSKEIAEYKELLNHHTQAVIRMESIVAHFFELTNMISYHKAAIDQLKIHIQELEKSEEDMHDKDTDQGGQ